jgi:hypothetical protein
MLFYIASYCVQRDPKACLVTDAPVIACACLLVPPTLLVEEYGSMGGRKGYWQKQWYRRHHGFSVVVIGFDIGVRYPYR